MPTSMLNVQSGKRYPQNPRTTAMEYVSAASPTRNAYSAPDHGMNRRDNRSPVAANTASAMPVFSGLRIAASTRFERSFIMGITRSVGAPSPSPTVVRASRRPARRCLLTRSPSRTAGDHQPDHRAHQRRAEQLTPPAEPAGARAGLSLVVRLALEQFEGPRAHDRQSEDDEAHVQGGACTKPRVLDPPRQPRAGADHGGPLEHTRRRVLAQPGVRGPTAKSRDQGGEEHQRSRDQRRVPDDAHRDEPEGRDLDHQAERHLGAPRDEVALVRHGCETRPRAMGHDGLEHRAQGHRRGG